VKNSLFVFEICYGSGDLARVGHRMPAGSVHM